jgi:hypothetical protein
MSVIAGDLVLYGAANMPEDDSSLTGGAIDLSTKIVHTALAAADTIDAVSDDALDTDQVYTIHGYDAAGSKKTEDLSLAGLTKDEGSQTFERITKIVKKSGSALAGTVTFTRHTGGSTIVTMESAADAAAGTEIDAVRTPFYGLASDPDNTKTAYEKVFFRNNNAATTLTDALIRLMDCPEDDTDFDTTVDQNSTKGTTTLYVADTTGIVADDVIVVGHGTARNEVHEVQSVNAGVSLTLKDNLKYDHTAVQADVVRESKVKFELEEELDGTDTTANRVTQPSGYAGYSWGGEEKYVRGAGGSYNHTAGAAQGIWLECALRAGDDPVKTSIEVRESGNTV